MNVIEALKNLAIDAWHKLPLIADILTTIGFLLTFWIALSVSRLRRQYVFKGRQPEITKDIRKYSSELSQLLDSNNLDGSVSEVVLRRCQSTLKTLKGIIPHDYRKAVKETERAIKSIIAKKDTNDRNSVRDIYNKLITVESDLDNIKKNEKWRLSQ